MTAARGMESDDDEMDDLHRHLFTVMMGDNWDHGIAPAVDGGGRFSRPETWWNHLASRRGVAWKLSRSMSTASWSGPSRMRAARLVCSANAAWNEPTWRANRSSGAAPIQTSSELTGSTP